MGDLSEHFSRHEFRCHCGMCGLDTIDSLTLDVLEDIRDHFGVPVTINSAYRCVSHNAAIGGATKSQHLYGRACDVDVEGVAPSKVADFVENGPLKGIGGVGRYDTFTHVDTRTNGPARWTG